MGCISHAVKIMRPRKHPIQGVASKQEHAPKKSDGQVAAAPS